MNKEELAGVFSHELAHVKNKDIFIGTLFATMAGAIVMMASMARWSVILGSIGGNNDDSNRMGIVNFVIMTILAPIAATIVQMAISRTREYLVD